MLTSLSNVGTGAGDVMCPCPYAGIFDTLIAWQMICDDGYFVALLRSLDGGREADDACHSEGRDMISRGNKDTLHIVWSGVPAPITTTCSPVMIFVYMGRPIPSLVCRRADISGQGLPQTAGEHTGWPAGSATGVQWPMVHDHSGILSLHLHNSLSLYPARCLSRIRQPHGSISESSSRATQ
jgi:hypothetical protein